LVKLLYALLSKYLSLLTTWGLLKILECSGTMKYETTEKGIDYLKVYKELIEEFGFLKKL